MSFMPWVMVLGGLSLVAALLFQIAVGKRWIKLGKKHLTVHKWLAWALLAFAVVHGLGGLTLVGIIKLP